MGRDFYPVRVSYLTALMPQYAYTEVCKEGTDMADEKRYYERKWHGGGGGVAPAYILGMIGAAVYYIQNAATFGDGVIGLLKALVWPAFLVYDLLRFVHG